MENPSPPRHHRLAWFALAAFGTLLLLPATRSLLRTQLKMEALTYSTETNLPAERAAAASLPDDYPVQLAAATPLPPTVNGNVTALGDGMARALTRTRNIAALSQRFPNNPSLYANLLRYMTLGEMRVMRDDDIVTPVAGRAVTVYRPAAESVAIFEAAAQKGAQLDPDNAYFPTMRAIGLFNAHRDGEALDSLQAAARCSRWAEYYQDDAEGQIRLQSLVYGERGALQRLSTYANLLFPQYSQLRSVARVAVRLASQQEAAGNAEAALAIRHAVMRCGGLMRSQGTSYITTLVGIAVANIATANPGGLEADNLTSGAKSGDDAERRRDQRRNTYYSYLEGQGHAQEAAWAKTELAAGDQAKAIETEAIKSSVFNGHNLFKLGLCWIANVALLSSALVLLALGASACLAGAVRPQKARWMWHAGYALLVVGGIGLWQWQTARLAMSPYVEIQGLFARLTGTGNANDTQSNALAVQRLAVGLGLLVPVLFVGLLGAMALFQRVPLATGLGRGLRGIAFPAAALVFLVYGASLLPTVYAESVVKSEIARTVRNEPAYYAEISHKAWPGDPQP
jgi:hypothetical protein